MSIFETKQFFSWLTWDPERICFTVPYFNHPVAWYGVTFALGFLAAYLLGCYYFLRDLSSSATLTSDDILDEKKMRALCQKYPKLFPKESSNSSEILSLLNKYVKLKILPFSFFKPGVLKIREELMQLADRLTSALVVGLILGARLGYFVFYGGIEFWSHPLDFFKLWEGGLASHGACFGIIAALIWVVWRQKNMRIKIQFLQILDILALISGVIAFFIRIGNFINQEIVGTPSQLPWAIIFKSPLSFEAVVPRHPVQLYEAFFYLFLAALGFILWRKSKISVGSGVYSGLILTLLFSFRFVIEFLKEHQGQVIEAGSSLQMGQILSLPFIFLGIYLLWLATSRKQKGARTI